MKLNDLRDEIFSLATKQGFHGKDENGLDQDDLSRKLLLVVSECCEAQEAERHGKKPLRDSVIFPENPPTAESFASVYRGAIEEEIADAVIRLADIAGMIGMDLEWWVKAKMIYNHSRPHRHGKDY